MHVSPDDPGSDGDGRGDARASVQTCSPADPVQAARRASGSSAARDAGDARSAIRLARVGVTSCSRIDQSMGGAGRGATRSSHVSVGPLEPVLCPMSVPTGILVGVRVNVLGSVLVFGIGRCGALSL